MIKFLLVALMLAAVGGSSLAQSATPTPSPTIFVGITQGPTQIYYTPTATPPVPDNIADKYELTVTAVAGEVSFETNGTQAFYNGRPLVPSINNANTITTIAYIKWLVGTGAQAVFGPLTPILLSLAGLIFINLVFATIYIWNNYVMLGLKAMWWFISLLIRILRGG